MPKTANRLLLQRTFLVTITLTLIAVLAISGCGSSDSESEKRTGPAEVTPADVAVYGAVTIDPDGETEKTVRELSKKIFKEAEPGDQVAKQLDSVFKTLGGQQALDGIDFTENVRPWLGQEIAGFITAGESDLKGRSNPLELVGSNAKGALLISTKDPKKTEDLYLEQVKRQPHSEGETTVDRSYRGSDYLLSKDGSLARGVVGSFLVIGSESGFKATVDAFRGKSLAETPKYRRSLARMDEDGRIAFVMVDLQKTVELNSFEAKYSRSKVQQLRRFYPKEPTVVGVFVKPDEILFRFDSDKAGSAYDKLALSASELLKSLPIDSWFALSMKNIGGFIDRAIKEAGPETESSVNQSLKPLGIDLKTDLTGWMGDAGIFVRGENVLQIDGGVVIESKNPSQSRRSITKLARLVAKELDLELQKESDGLSLITPAAPIEIVQRGNRVVITYGRQAAEAAVKTDAGIAQSGSFKDSLDRLGTGFEPFFLLDLENVKNLTQLAADDPDIQKVNSYLEALDSIVGGTKEEGNQIKSRVVIEVK